MTKNLIGHRLEIFFRDPELDTRGQLLRDKLNALDLSATVDNLRLSEVYTLEGDFSPVRLREVAGLLLNPVIHDVLIDEPRPLGPADVVLEVGFLPGVTDNIGHSAAETLADAWGKALSSDQGIYSSTVYYIEAKNLSDGDYHLIGRFLANALIERLHWKDRSTYVAEVGMDLVIPRVMLKEHKGVSRVDLNIPEAELVALGKGGIIDHYDAAGNPVRRGPLALDLNSLKAIADYFAEVEKRAPTDLELEALAQTWSEHCKHTIFAAALDDLEDGLYKTYIKGATKKIRKDRGDDDICVSVFVDNSGGIIFDDDYLVTDKVETHNSPSALDPFGGSITGIVGVNRDTVGFGLGAKPIINRYGFCVADPADQEPLYRLPQQTNQALRPRRILDGIVDGVRVGGNCSGIPTTQGFLTFHPGYKGKPLVFVGTVGLLPRVTQAGRLSHEKAALAGDYIVVLGGRVGLDGIHGATFSSEALTGGSPATAVQIGDPITQKKFSDAIVKEALQRNLYSSITDNGAGGISCSVAEMARECGGCRVELEKVPVKYPGMSPWEIWISESQERMTLAVPSEKWPELEKLMQSRGVEATVIGEFTASGRCQVSYNGESVMDIELEFLHDGLPNKHLTTKIWPSAENDVLLPEAADLVLTDLFLKMFKRLNLASHAYVANQYDFEVQGGTVLKPLVGRGQVDAFTTVVQPLPESEKGVSLSQSLYPALSDIDTYAAAAFAIDTAVRNLMAVGTPLSRMALLDNFCWCSSDDPERLWQLKECVRACYETAVVYGTPFISGKDSMYNDFSGFDADDNEVKISVPPTILISSIGVVPDVARVRSFAFVKPGDLIYLLGAYLPADYDLGGSEYLALLRDEGLVVDTAAGHAPQFAPVTQLPFYQKVEKAVATGQFHSLYSLAQGGLAIAAGKGAMAEGLGFELQVPGGDRADLFLFNEHPGRFLVTIAPDKAPGLEKALAENCCLQLGRVRDDDKIIVRQNNTVAVETTTTELLSAYRSTFAGF
ncbi:MAG TPA: phosphoribosylformylglycinamidine synthase [Desulfarculaceae bacterium]|nr:phosphoribosylformylglycinamidine synthase [Desulfarculaceae bacterium]